MPCQEAAKFSRKYYQQSSEQSLHHAVCGVDGAVAVDEVMWKERLVWCISALETKYIYC